MVAVTVSACEALHWGLGLGHHECDDDDDDGNNDGGSGGGDDDDDDDDDRDFRNENLVGGKIEMVLFIYLFGSLVFHGHQ